MRTLGWFMSAAALVFAGAAMGQVRYSDQPPPPPGYGYGQPGNWHHHHRTVSCGSPQFKFARCPAPGNWPGARLVRQTSSSSCVQGRTWGYQRGSIWVDKGCGGIFAEGRYAGGWQPGPGWNQNFAMSCGSPQYRRNFCQVDVGSRGSVRIQRQLSSARCTEGSTWGYNRGGIWVDKGCSAQFLVMRRR